MLCVNTEEHILKLMRIPELDIFLLTSEVFILQCCMFYYKFLYFSTVEAENIMQFEMDLLELPCGLPSASSIDQARLDNDEKKKLHPSVPPI